MEDFLDFNPSDLSVFQEQEEAPAVNANVYNTNPVKYSTSEDKHYHARVRVIYNIFDPREGSVVKQVIYAMQDENGFFSANSKLAIGKKNDCPLFTSWKKLHFSNDPKKDNWAKEMFDKREIQWVTVQVIEDDNNPELVGKILAFKLPKSIWNKMEAKMNPSPESKKTPQPIMDYLFGPILDLDVAPGPDDKEHPERKQREISYDLCDFEADPTPIIKIDGTPLFNDDEIETIEKYMALNNAVLKAKTEKTKEAKLKEKAELVPAVKELYKKATDYLKENSLDIRAEKGFKEWDENLTNRVNNWLNKVMAMKDPRIPENHTIEVPTVTENNTKGSEDNGADYSDDDLPF